MSFSVFLAVFFSGIVLCILISYISLNYQYRHAFDASRERIDDFADAYSVMVVSNGNQMAPTEYMESELSTFADILGARVLVIDAQYKTVYDSFHTKTGSTMVAKGFASCLKGKGSFSLDENEKKATKLVSVSGREGRAVGILAVVYPVSVEMTRYATQRRMVILLVLCATIIMFAFSVFCAHRVVQPMREINKELRSINDGNTDKRLDVRDNIQVNAITDSINTLLERTRETEETRKNFISDVSHELKTPMASMKVLADALLMSGGELPDTVREFLEDINSEIDRENHIISDLLTLARMDRRTDTVKFARTHINELLSVILKRIQPLAKKREVEVVYESYRDIYAEVDEPKLLTAITNLVENAILYNRPQGSVFVTLNANMTYFFITVQDTGYGIPEADIAHIFERFYRVDKDRSRETGGTGLGLSITKEVVAAHGGQIKAYSKENEGTTFSVRIPLARHERGRKA